MASKLPTEHRLPWLSVAISLDLNHLHGSIYMQVPVGFPRIYSHACPLRIRAVFASLLPSISRGAAGNHW